MVKAHGTNAPPFHRYFKLTIQAPGSQPFKLPLGSSLDFKLDIKPAGGKGSDSRWRLFGDDKQTEEFLRGIPNTEPALYNVLQFNKNSNLNSFYCFDGFKNNSPAIGLGDKETNAGVVITMPDYEKPHVCEIVALIGDLSKSNNAWKIPKQLEAEIDTLERFAVSKPQSGAGEEDKKRHSDKAGAAKAEAKKLRERRDAAIDVLKNFKDVPVRWTLCPLNVPGDPSQGVDESKGLVIIDSLSDPKSDR
jgi:hypothetical protein